MSLVAVINTPIGPSNYEILRDRIAEILGLEFTLQKVSFGLAPELCPAKVNTERFINIDETTFPVMNVRLFRGTYLDEDGKQTQDGGGTRFGTYEYHIDTYTGAASDADSFGDEIAAKNLQRMMGIVMAILEDTRYATLGYDPKASGICNTHVSHFFIKEAGENEDAIDYICGRVVFKVMVPEQVTMPEPRSLLMTTVTMQMAGQDEFIFSQLLQMQIGVVDTGDTLTNAFFSNPVVSLELLDNRGNTTATYVLNTDFTITGTTAIASTFTFTAGQTFVAKT